MSMLKNPATKYRPFTAIDLPNRTWPNKTITTAPMWMSTDLRDGNQALFDPMNIETKLKFFNLLVEIGLKEIEIGFPSASQIDFDFARKLVTENLIPDDVVVGVLTQAREDLIDKTFEALAGAKKATIHFYNAVAPNFRKIVFRKDVQGVIQIAQHAAQYIKQKIQQYPQTKWIVEYSPEVFSSTELEVSLAVSEAVIDIIEPNTQNKLILNLPATVESSTPNIYADQIEYIHTNIKNRDSLIISVHPHNDRGTGIAAAELALMAGADRIEGCLFGNGERTGNVDLVTLALNLYTQGIDPKLNFSNINEIARIVEECNKLPIHPRHPYVGDLVFTAFSGSHQDAIKKGFAMQQADGFWEVPYMPIDPADLGRNYASVIRVNSQSGKGGIAYLMESVYGLVMPRRLQVEFSSAVQKVTDELAQELSAQELWQIFQTEYTNNTKPLQLISYQFSQEQDEVQHIQIKFTFNDNKYEKIGKGNGPLDALIDALSLPITIHSYQERALSTGSNANAITIAELSRTDGNSNTTFGAGIHSNITTASIMAIINAANRLEKIDNFMTNYIK